MKQKQGCAEYPGTVFLAGKGNREHLDINIIAKHYCY